LKSLKPIHLLWRHTIIQLDIGIKNLFNLRFSPEKGKPDLDGFWSALAQEPIVKPFAITNAVTAAIKRQ
jgi:hypothetical protein